MTDAQAWTVFYMALGASAVVVLIAASLLLVIRITAGAIDGLAQAALGTARTIVINTDPIWDLHAVDDVAGRILDGAESIAARAAAIADAAAGEQRT